MTTVQSMIPSISGYVLGLDWVTLGRMALLMGVGVCILGGLLRLVFGKGSAMVKAVSACIHVVLIYLIAITLYALAPQLRSAIPPLPFLSIQADHCAILDFTALSAESFFSGIFQLFILSFLANLMEDLIPKGSKLLGWYFYRLLSACCALGMYLGIYLLICRFAPQIFGTWAIYILLSIWILIGILGLSKGLLTLIAAVFNPLLGLLFAFFFKNLVGRQLTKAILTSLLFLGILYGLLHCGFTGFVFSGFSIAAFAPSLFISLICLYLFGTYL